MGNPGVKTGIFLQARLNSERLPGKALCTLKGLTVIEHAMQALGRIKAEVYALLTDEKSAPIFKEYGERCGFMLFIGPSRDVLKRFCLAAVHFGVTRVVRATGDNPLVSFELGKLNLKIHEKSRPDLSRFSGGPLGTGVEVVEAQALHRSCRESDDPYEHEHITTYILRNRNKFKVREIRCPKEFYFPQARVTLDTEEDLKIINAVYSDLYAGKPIKIKELIKWLKKHRELELPKQKAIETGTSFSSPQ
jgi:spore coat polysaccharide biosynthesis protein SpsF